MKRMTLSVPIPFSAKEPMKSLWGGMQSAKLILDPAFVLGEQPDKLLLHHFGTVGQGDDLLAVVTGNGLHSSFQVSGPGKAYPAVLGIDHQLRIPGDQGFES
jgi:hypothetical protein